MNALTNIEHRFWSRVRIGDGCWLWCGAVSSSGYGQARHEGRDQTASRVAMLLSGTESGTELRADQQACHHCDVKLCVRPSHLFAGTRVENMQDAVAKGRVARGERAGHAKLTEADVVAIRRGRSEGMKLRELAEQHGVTKENVYDIVHRRTWRHVS